MLKCSSETAVFKAEEEGDDVKSAWSFDALGHTRATMVSNNGLAKPKGGANPIKPGLSSD